MANVVVVGAQWGDEGKGKVVDLLTADSDAVVRFGGGANAGHTLVVGGEKEFWFSFWVEAFPGPAAGRSRCIPYPSPPSIRTRP